MRTRLVWSGLSLAVSDDYSSSFAMDFLSCRLLHLGLLFGGFPLWVFFLVWDWE